MAAIIQINRGGICGICMTEFVDGESQYTHVGGEGHDGFHRPCLILILRANPTCPYDQTSINRDLSYLLTRTERIMQRVRPALQIMQRVRPALQNAALATTERIMQRIRPALENAALAIIFALASEGGGLAVVVNARVPVAVRAVGITVAAGALAGVAGLVGAVGAVGLAGAAGGLAVVATEAGTERAAAVAGAVVALAVGVRNMHDRILEVADPINGENIFGGLILGTITAFALTAFNLRPAPNSISIMTALSSGVAAGALSFIR